jgi:hypothetical protein
MEAAPARLRGGGLRVCRQLARAPYSCAAAAAARTCSCGSGVAQTSKKMIVFKMVSHKVSKYLCNLCV